MRSSKPINPYYEPIPDIEKESKRKSLKRIIRKIINHFKKQPTKIRPLQNELYLFYEEQIREIDAREAQAKEAQAKEAQAKEAQAKEAQAKEAQAKEAQVKEAQAKEELVETELAETEPTKVELQLPSNERDPFLFFFARVALGELKYPEKPIFNNYCNEEQPTPSSATENPYQEALNEINMKYDSSKEIRLKRDPFDLPMGVFDLDVEVDPIKREIPPMNFNSFDGTKVDHSDEEQLVGDKHFFDIKGDPIRLELGGTNSSIPSLMPGRTKIIVGVSAKKVQKVQSSKALSDSQYPNQKEQKQQELPIQVKNEESPAHDGLPDKESTQAKLDNTPPSSPISSMNRSNLKGLHESPISTYTGNTSPLMKPVFIKPQEILITNITQQQKQEQQNNILDEVSIDNCDSNLKDDNNLPLISVFPKHYNLKYKRKYESTNKSHTTISPSKTSLMPSFMDFLNF